jgi:hypothetical protein
MCSLTTECVLLLQNYTNLFAYTRTTPIVLCGSRLAAWRDSSSFLPRAVCAAGHPAGTSPVHTRARAHACTLMISLSNHSNEKMKSKGRQDPWGRAERERERERALLGRGRQDPWGRAERLIHLRERERERD